MNDPAASVHKTLAELAAEAPSGTVLLRPGQAEAIVAGIEAGQGIRVEHAEDHGRQPERQAMTPAERSEHFQASIVRDLDALTERQRARLDAQTAALYENLAEILADKHPRESRAAR